MGILPAEITQRIIHLLVFDWVQLIPGTIPVARLTQDAGRYAAVSRAWQDVVERETFADLRLDQSRLARLRDIATPRRRGYVRTIRLDAVLPRAGSLGKPESHGEALRNDAALQATFEAFLQTLSQWSAAEMHPVGVALSVDAWAPVDLGGGVFGPEYRDRWAEARRRRHEDSALELTDPESIWRQPKVEGIISLKSSARNGKRRIAAAAMCSLLARLPAARTASFEWWHDQEDDRMRSEFHDALLQVAHPMDSLRIIGTFNTPVNRLHAADAPPETDALSQTIRAVSQRLKSCSLYHVAVSEEIFFPLCLDVKDGAPHWQRLEGFYLNFPPATPCGQLLFETEPAAAGSDDEDAASSTSSVDSDSRHQQRRLKPGKATAKMQRFHLAAARAALEMPLLKNMVLTADLSLVGGDFLEDWHAFSYRAKGPRPTAVWTSSSGFVPEDDVLTCWREVSTRHAGAELEVKIVCDVDAV